MNALTIKNVLTVNYAIHFGVALLVSLVAFIFSSTLGSWLLGISIVVFMLANSFCVIDAGTAGYIKVLGKVYRRTLLPGLNFVLPFVTTITRIDTTKKPHEHTITDVETSDIYKMGYTYTIHYGFNPYEVWCIANNLVLPLEENYFCVWLTEIFKDITKQYTHADIKGNAAITDQLKQDVRDIFAQKVRDKMNELCASSTILSYLDLTIKDFIFDPAFIKATVELETAKINTEKAKEERKQIEELAEARKTAAMKQAEAEAFAVAAKGKAEADALKKKGKAIDEHPNTIKQTIAENYPKVVGGNPLVNLNLEGD
ncbi:MAG: hypothetical protein J6C85_05510 [Alphaproteobacteria bacterium]|nr:hypothetical protein [Alphaproteobacteria bacterium]